jgi:uncharacterized protein
VIAVDAGFLYALVDPKDAWHGRSVAAAHTAQQEGWITTWPVVVEACHLLSHRLGAEFSAGLLDDVADQALMLWELRTDAASRMAKLMRKYAALPMDLADASLVLLAEHLGHGRILSTDERDFKTYRWKRRKPFHNLLEAPT